MTKPIINIADVELKPRPAAMAATGPAAERYDARMALVSRSLGAQKLGYNITAVPPGKRAFPFHNHLATEEMFYVIEGEGEVRIGEAVHPIRAGDIIACPPGGKETAHQIVNTGKTELKYLAVSNRVPADVAEYPDSGKFGVLGQYPGDADGRAPMFMFIGRAGQSGDYWEGE